MQQKSRIKSKAGFMEVFADGGLFEIIGLLLFASLTNYIFSKKYLLIIFSAVAITAPILLVLVRDSEIFYWVIGVLMFNSILFVSLLWKVWRGNSDKRLFDTSFLKRKLVQFKDKAKMRG